MLGPERLGSRMPDRERLGPEKRLGREGPGPEMLGPETLGPETPDRERLGPEKRLPREGPWLLEVASENECRSSWL